MWPATLLHFSVQTGPLSKISRFDEICYFEHNNSRSRFNWMKSQETDQMMFVILMKFDLGNYDYEWHWVWVEQNFWHLQESASHPARRCCRMLQVSQSQAWSFTSPSGWNQVYHPRQSESQTSIFQTLNLRPSSLQASQTTWFLVRFCKPRITTPPDFQTWRRADVQNFSQAGVEPCGFSCFVVCFQAVLLVTSNWLM